MQIMSKPILVQTDRGLALQDSSGHQLLIDFVKDKNSYWRPMPKKTNELLPKAIGVRNEHKKILDLTAGLCRDAFFLARLDCQITALERAKEIYLLLQDAFIRANSDESVSSVLERIKLVHSDAKTYLQSCDLKSFDVIYYDPMYPQKNNKTAKSQLAMTLFRDLIGEDTDWQEQVTELLMLKNIRVVIKRPLSAEIIAKPQHSYEGKAVRYDVYQL